MTLREKQSLFIRNVARLILWTFDNGMELTFGEALRTPAQQLLYFEGYTVEKIGSGLHLRKTERKSKTIQSKHIEKLAVDLNLFIGGVYKVDKESYKPLAEYWKSLHKHNVAGYDWGWDANHFEMK